MRKHRAVAGREPTAWTWPHACAHAAWQCTHLRSAKRDVGLWPQIGWLGKGRGAGGQVEGRLVGPRVPRQGQAGQEVLGGGIGGEGRGEGGGSSGQHCMQAANKCAARVNDSTQHTAQHSTPRRPPPTHRVVPQQHVVELAGRRVVLELEHHAGPRGGRQPPLGLGLGRARGLWPRGPRASPAGLGPGASPGVVLKGQCGAVRVQVQVGQATRGGGGRGAQAGGGRPSPDEAWPPPPPGGAAACSRASDAQACR